MKKCISLLLSLFLAMGCSKNNSIDSVTYQSTLLVNNTYNIGKWKLATLVIGKVVQSLTPAQIAYVKYYKEDLKFSDSDGSMGTWRIPAADSLVEVFTNFSSGISVSQAYKINSINTNQLNLTYTVTGTEINAIYTATN